MSIPPRASAEALSETKRCHSSQPKTSLETCIFVYSALGGTNISKLWCVESLVSIQGKGRHINFGMDVVLSLDDSRYL